jgi:MFS family permease
MTGPLLILPVIFLGQENLAFVISSILYAIGLFLVLSIRTSSRGVMDGGRNVLQNLGQGLGFVYSHKTLFSLFALVVLHCALTMSYETLFPVLSRDRLGLEAGSGLYKGGSLLMISVGFGSFISSFGLAGVQGQVTRGKAFFALGILSGLSPIALGLSTTLTMAMGAAFFVGISQAGFMTLSSVMVQQMVPDAIRGRVMAVYSWHIQGFMASFNLVNGVLADSLWLDATRILSGMGSAFAGIMMLSYFRMPLRLIYRQGVITGAREEART